MDKNELATRAVRLGIEVHRNLRPGLLESSKGVLLCFLCDSVTLWCINLMEDS